MRVIITGGTGLIGKELANGLAADHHEVIVLSRNIHKTSGFDPSVRVVKWDGRTANGWGELAEGAGAIVNLAGESISGESFFPTRWSAERKKTLLQSRLDAGSAVVDAIASAQNKPGVLIQSSAVGYYGIGTEPMTELSPSGDDFLADVCRQWEASTAEVEAMGVRRVIVRTGVVLSMKGGAFTRLVFPFQLFAGGPLGNGKQMFSWIHLQDEMRAIRFLIEHTEASGAYNLTAPQPLNNADFAKLLGNVMKRPAFIPVPGFAFKLGFGEVATVVLDGQNVLPKRLTDMGFTWLFPDAHSAVEDLLHNKPHETEAAHAH